MSMAYRATSMNLSFISLSLLSFLLLFLYVYTSMRLTLCPSLHPSCHLSFAILIFFPPFSLSISPLLMPVCCPFSPCQKRSLTTDNLLPFLPPNPFTTFRYCLHAKRRGVQPARSLWATPVLLAFPAPLLLLSLALLITSSKLWTVRALYSPAWAAWSLAWLQL